VEQLTPHVQTEGSRTVELLAEPSSSGDWSYRLASPGDDRQSHCNVEIVRLSVGVELSRKKLNCRDQARCR
jgi:hypothetical protein